MYLSRQVGTTTAWQVEVWTTANGGASWTSQPVSAPSTEKNVRPVSPRGMAPFGGDLSTIWMRGAYPNYEEYATDIAVLDAPPTPSPWRTRSPRSETVRPVARALRRLALRGP